MATLRIVRCGACSAPLNSTYDADQGPPAYQLCRSCEAAGAAGEAPRQASGCPSCGSEEATLTRRVYYRLYAGEDGETGFWHDYDEYDSDDIEATCDGCGAFVSYDYA